MAEIWPSTVDLGGYVADAKTAQLKLRVPAPVVLLADDLLTELPRRVGARNVSELVAALLVAAAKADPEALSQALGDYRETRTHTVLRTTRTSGAHLLPSRRGELT